MPSLLFVLVLCVLTGSGFCQESGLCSQTNRAQDLQSCLAAVGSRAQDESQFWFGTSFRDRCPGGAFSQRVGCFLPQGFPQTISSLIFTPGTFDSGTLDRYLEVVYTSPSGTYSGCDNEYSFSHTRRFALDPLSSEMHACWDARVRPDMTWTTAPGEYYSLVVYDAAYGFIHGIYVNIMGNDIANSEEVKPYHGPLSVSRLGNVYVFLVFVQPQRIAVDPRFTNRYPGQPFNVSEFMDVHGLSGPVAMNWLQALGDPYSVGIQRGNGVVDNCPMFISDATQLQNRPFLTGATGLEASVGVTFDPPSIGFASCCEAFEYGRKVVTANPLGNGQIDAAVARLAPSVTITLTKVMFRPETDFQGKLYTLAMVDPDVPFASAGTNARPLLHWLVLNIPRGVVANGNEVLTYMGPSPPDQKPHYYYFLLYEQQGPIATDSHRQFAGSSCGNRLIDRCLFNVSGFAAGNGLRIVGASWFVSRNDGYVRYVHIVERGRPEEEVCGEVPGYSPYCVIASGSRRLVSSISSLLIVITLSSFARGAL